MKLWLEENAIEMYSSYNKGKSIVAERFIRTLKNKIYKYMTSVLKNVYIDKLDDIVNTDNSTYHRKREKMKFVDLKSITCIDFNRETNKDRQKFKVGGSVRISFLQNVLLPIGQLKNLKVLCLGHMLLVILKVKKLLEDQIKKSLGLKK